MKIEVTEGCIAYGCTINNEDYNEVDANTLRKILHDMIDNCEDDDTLRELIWEATTKLGEYEYKGRCDECGDTIISYTYTFNDNTDDAKK